MNKYLSCLVLLMLLTGCAARKISFTPTFYYTETDNRNISDEEILQAFEAKPQLKLPVKIAWYNMGTDNLMDSLIIPHENISENYEIPQTLVEGNRPHFFPNQNYYNQSKSINLNLIRLLGARAKCDIVILVSSRFEEKREMNALSLLNIFMLPALFTPYLNIEYYYEGEAQIFDIRNGYLYMDVKTSSDDAANYITVMGLENNAKKTKKKLQQDAVEYLQYEIYSLFESVEKTE